MTDALFSDAPISTPLAVTLRPYQRAAVDAVYTWFETHDTNPLIVVPTGGGKSLIAAAFIHSVVTQFQSERILILTHVRELIAQNHAALLRAWPGAVAGICSAGIGRKEFDARILFAGIQTVHKKAERIGWTDLVVVDECFVAGTDVSTPNGATKIENLRVGDKVKNAIGIGVVEAVSTSVRDVIEVELTNGRVIRCTPEHPFFTDRGWVRAGSMVIGEITYSEQAVRALWQGVPAMAEDESGRFGASRLPGSRMEQADLLLSILRQEAQEPDEQQSGASADARNTSQDKASADQERRERSSVAASATRLVACARRRVGVGGCGPDRWQGTGSRTSYSLQDRHREPVRDARNRTGRRITLRRFPEGTGRTKADVPDVVRVARVSYPERGCAAPVFNLRVSGHPSFFAGGVLVHNCHLISGEADGMYRRFLGDLSSMNPKMKVIGLTATPYRTDSGRLDKGPGKLFGGIAYECDLVQLIEDGYLSRVISRGTKATIDTSEVHKRGGEFIAGELEMAAMLGDLVPQAAQEILSRAEGRKSLLLFCCGIAHAQAMAERMNALGVECECVFGNTPKEERDEILARFKRGELRAISNFGVLTTGFDAPNVDLIALLRPTCSPGLYVQMVGRGLRIAPGKADCLVLDFGQNVLRHGPLDHVQPTEKDGSEEPGEAPMKECPECMLLVAISARECPECGYEFPPPLATKHDPTPDERLEILRGKAAIVRWDVQRVDYREHHKKDKPVSLRVDYHCGFHQTVSEWVCFEHEGYARKRAEQWWKANGGALPVPETVDMARVRIDMGALRRVVSVTVDQREEYPKLLGVRHAEAGVVAMAIPEDEIPF